MEQNPHKLRDRLCLLFLLASLIPLLAVAFLYFPRHPIPHYILEEYTEESPAEEEPYETEILPKPPQEESEEASEDSSAQPAPPAESAPSSEALPPELQPEEPEPPAPALPAADAGSYIVGYFASWSDASTAYSLNASQLTHIHYAFAGIDSQNQVYLPNPSRDEANLAALIGLREENPSLKVLLSIGGWDYSRNFSNAALTEQSRQAFAQSCLELVRAYDLDGIDLDWEYPVSGGMGNNINRPEDRENFTKLLAALRETFDAEAQRTGRRYYLAIAGAPNADYLNKIQLGSVQSYVDYIFLMCYDMHGPWDSYADLNAPLYTPSGNTPQYQISVDSGVRTYLNAGADPSKLVLGMPFYGYRYSTEQGGLYSPFSTASSISYRNLLPLLSQYERQFHSEALVPYLEGDGFFLTYDDPESIAYKVQYARRQGLAGVGIWELSQDSGGALLSAAWNAMQ